MSKEDREKLKQQVTEVVNKQFEVRQQRRALELKRLEEQLKRLREIVERLPRRKRNSSKSEFRNSSVPRSPASSSSPASERSLPSLERQLYCRPWDGSYNLPPQPLSSAEKLLPSTKRLSFTRGGVSALVGTCCSHAALSCLCQFSSFAILPEILLFCH